MNDRLISVIVPVYKAEMYLNQCVESIVNQTYKNLEIILVDDGSPDSSPQICDEWAERDSRIKVIHKKNGGVASARNAGLDIALGEYIGFVDSDDYIEADMYETLEKQLQKSEKKLVSCALDFVTADGIVTGSVGCIEAVNLNTSEAIRAILRGKIGCSMCTKLFRREIFCDFRFNEGETNEEIPLIIPLMRKADGMYHVGRVLYHYVRHGGNLTENGWRTGNDIVLKNFERLEDAIVQSNLTECRTAFRQYIAREAFSMACQLDKRYNKLNGHAKENLKKYIDLMRKNVWFFMIASNRKIKEKVLYILIVTRLSRIIYR